MALDLQPLLLAVLNGKLYIKDFTYKKYGSAFIRYKEQYCSAFACAIDGSDHQQLANEVYQGLEQAWLRKKIGRKETIIEAKMMITLYLTPMLLEIGAEGESFATALCQKWKDSNPGDRYEICTYEQISKSFHRVLFGFDLGRAADKKPGFRFFWS